MNAINFTPDGAPDQPATFTEYLIHALQLLESESALTRSSLQAADDADFGDLLARIHRVVEIISEVTL
jgi:hypothetical protein